MNKDMILQQAAGMGLPLSEADAVRLAAYADAILEQNQTVNLTAVTGEEEFIVLHLLDSLTAAALPEISGAVADVGTGGGFPGAVIAAVRPDCAVTLIDATEKKLRAAESAAAGAGIPVKTLHGRAEELAKTPECRERFHSVTARAVAALPALLEYCLPLVTPGGYFIAMKGSDAGTELERSQKALEMLGGAVRRTVHTELPDGSVRCLIVVEKILPTPDGYPRRNTAIRSRPL